MTIEKIETSQAPGAIAPYSQAIKAGNLLFLSGQIPLDPVTGEIVGKTVEEQTLQVLKNIKAILAAAGLSLQEVTSVIVFLSHFDRDFQAMNNIYAKEFSHEVKPARTTIGVSALPKGALVEIQCTAYHKNS